MSGGFVCVAAAASDERDDVKAEAFAALVSEDDTIANVDSSSVVRGLNVMVVLDPTAVRLGTNAVSDEVVVSYEVLAWVLEVDERTEDPDNDEGVMILGKVYVVDEFTAPTIEVVDAETVTFEDDIELIGVGHTPMLSALIISAAFKSS